MKLGRISNSPHVIVQYNPQIYLSLSEGILFEVELGTGVGKISRIGFPTLGTLQGGRGRRIGCCLLGRQCGRGLSWPNRPIRVR